MSSKTKKIIYIAVNLLLLLTATIRVIPANAQQSQGSVGVEGRIGSTPPTTASTISVPRDGQVFTQIPITVSGLCSGDVLVKLFKNNVFGGSAVCSNGSYSIITDLFVGRNELMTRVYDALDQAGPDSNIVTVTYNPPTGGSAAARPTLTSNFAKKGANPGETLTWPIILSGGQGPYAVSVDWGDGKPSDILTQEFAGTFNIKHVYDSPGVYNITIRVSDKNESVGFLQLVGVANGAIGQDDGNNGAAQVIERTRYLWQPMLISIPFLISTFWLGRRYQVKLLRDRIERGERPW